MYPKDVDDRSRYEPMAGEGEGPGVCPTCKGHRGEFRAECLGSSQMRLKVWHTCPDCNGSGEIDPDDET